MEIQHEEYTIDTSARCSNCPQLIVEVAPCHLWELFGYPRVPGNFDGSVGDYIFVSPSNDVIAVGYLTETVWQLLSGFVRKRFWRSRSIKRLNIEAENREIAEVFSEWLSHKVKCKIYDWP